MLKMKFNKQYRLLNNGSVADYFYLPVIVYCEENAIYEVRVSDEAPDIKNNK